MFLPKGVQRQAFRRERERVGLEVVSFCYQACTAAIELLHLPNDGFQFRDFFSQASPKTQTGSRMTKKVFAWGILTFKLEIRFDSFQSLPKLFVSSLLHRFNENQLKMFYLKIFFELPSSQLHDDISCFKNFKRVCFI